MGSKRKALVCGAGGFIGHQLVRALVGGGMWVRGADLKRNEFEESNADEFVIGDLRDPHVCRNVVDQRFDEVYQLAADMGGAGFVFTGENDADIMHNSALINLNILDACRKEKVRRLFYSSSACIYPEYNQTDPDNPTLSEDSAYPAQPDSEYGWEKLFGERLYLSYGRNCGMEVRIARYHNIYGPLGAWNNGREKSPAALCRKVAVSGDSEEIEIWGDGEQTRSFLYIDDCLEATIRLMRSDWTGPVNIGSEEMVSINEFAGMIMEIADKRLTLKHVPGPIGVRGRRSDNRLILDRLGWEPKVSLRTGIEITYKWIEQQVKEWRGVKGLAK